MSLLWHPRQQKVSQEFAVFWGLTNDLLLEPSTCHCSSEFHPNGHGKLLSPPGVGQLWLNLQAENVFCQHSYGCFCRLFHIFLRRNRTTKAVQQGERGKKIALVKRECARNSVIFCFWCKHQTPWCKRLKLKRKISFSMRRTFPLPSSANSYFLFSNFAAWDFILFTLDFNT